MSLQGLTWSPASVTDWHMQDLKNALSPAETCEALGLPHMKVRKWHVQVRLVSSIWAQL